jgi:hypothetical protein
MDWSGDIFAAEMRVTSHHSPQMHKNREERILIFLVALCFASPERVKQERCEAAGNVNQAIVD